MSYFISLGFCSFEDSSQRRREREREDLRESKIRIGGNIRFKRGWRKGHKNYAVRLLGDINVGSLLILSSCLNSVVQSCHDIVGCIAGKDALSTISPLRLSHLLTSSLMSLEWYISAQWIQSIPLCS